MHTTEVHKIKLN